MDKPAPDILLDRFELDHEPEVIGEGRFSTLLKVGGCVKGLLLLKIILLMAAVSASVFDVPVRQPVQSTGRSAQHATLPLILSYYLNVTSPTISFNISRHMYWMTSKKASRKVVDM